MGIASGETGEMGVVSEVADQGVLVVVVHVRDDSVLCCFIWALGGFVRHSGSDADVSLCSVGTLST